MGRRRLGRCGVLRLRVPGHIGRGFQGTGGLSRSDRFRRGNCGGCGNRGSRGRRWGRERGCGRLFRRHRRKRFLRGLFPCAGERKVIGRALRGIAAADGGRRQGGVEDFGCDMATLAVVNMRPFGVAHPVHVADMRITGHFLRKKGVQTVLVGRKILAGQREHPARLFASLKTARAGYKRQRGIFGAGRHAGVKGHSGVRARRIVFLDGIFKPGRGARSPAPAKKKGS